MTLVHVAVMQRMMCPSKGACVGTAELHSLLGTALTHPLVYALHLLLLGRVDSHLACGIIPSHRLSITHTAQQTTALQTGLSLQQDRKRVLT